MKKIFLFGLIVALGTFFAEVLSFNFVTALINPFGYVAYGLLYILFLQITERQEKPSWKQYYLLGVLVGFITEAFVPKVIFFGWGDDSFLIFDTIPFESIFLTVLYHPFSSFIIPMIFLKRYFKIPLKIDFGKYEKPLIYFGFASPFVLGSFNGTIEVIPFLFLSVLVIAIWTMLIKRYPAESLFLSRRSIISTALVTTAFFIFSFFAFPAFGREEILIPSAQAVVAALLFIAFIFFRVYKMYIPSSILEYPAIEIAPVRKIVAMFLTWMSLLSVAIVSGVVRFMGVIFIFYFFVGTIPAIVLFFKSLSNKS